MKTLIVFNHSNEEEKQEQYGLVEAYLSELNFDYDQDVYNELMSFSKVTKIAIEENVSKIVVPSIHSLKGSLTDLVKSIDILAQHNIKFIAVREGLGDSLYESKAALMALSILSDFNKQQESLKIKIGMSKSLRSNGRPESPKKKFARKLLEENKLSIREIVRQSGLSKSTIARIRREMMAVA